MTGSRIARDTFNSASPVQVITRDETVAGFSSTTEALQGTGVTAGGSADQQRVRRLRHRRRPRRQHNLAARPGRDAHAGAAQRPPRGAGRYARLGRLGRPERAADRRSIDRIEVLKDGASSIYGSDAIAGVINIITKKNIDGVTFEAQYN